MKISRNNSILIFLLCVSPLIASTEKGRLIDAGNKKLSGYLIENTSNNKSAKSDKYGEFMIDVSKGDTLKVYLDGVYLYDYVASGEKIIISLPNNPYRNVIETVSYGKVDREKTSAAIDFVGFDKLEGHSFINGKHSITGKLSSLWTTLTCGLPESDGQNLFIRGKSSFNSNTPLVLVDGFESPIYNLNIEEIESVSVLKDAVATALYGLRGANGVLLVKTKKGTEGKSQFKLNFDFGVVQPVSVPEFVDASTYASMVNEARANDGLTPRYTDEELSLQGTDPYRYPDVDWREEMLKKSSFVTNTSLQFTGGSGKVRYYALLNHSYYEGAFLNTDKNPKYNTQNKLNRFNFRANVSMDITENTELNIRMGGRIKEETYPEVGSESFYNTLLSTPANRYVIYNEDGSYGGNNVYRNNPMGMMVGKGYDSRHARFVNTNLDLSHKMDYLLKGLSLNLAASFMTDFNVREQYRGASFAVKELVSAPGEDPVYIEYGKNKVLKYSSRAVTQDRTQNFRGSIDYDRKWGEKHSLSATMLADFSEQVYQNEAEAYRYMMFGITANYGLYGKYYADIVASYNGTNTYNPDHQFGFFPAGGLSWIISKEDFMKNIKWIDFLKFRTSYGLVGSDAIGSYRRFMYLNNFSGNGSHRFGETAGTSIDGLSESALANPDASWEKDYKFNIGFDVRLFQNLSFTFDYFREKRTGILQSIDPWITDMVGIGLPQINYGEVKNHGFDTSLSYVKTCKNGFTWGIDANMGLAKNKIEKYAEMQYTVNSRIGNSISAIYGYVSDGLYMNQNEIDEGPVNTFYNVQPGDIKLVDMNSDDVINEYDKVVIGDDFPSVRYGINFNMAYKGAYLVAEFDGMADYQKMLSSNIVYNPLNGGSGNISKYAAENYWRPDRAETATLPRLTTLVNYNNDKPNTIYMKDAGFIRLRTLEIGYSWNTENLRRLKMSGLKLFLRGHNLFSIDKMGELDPEITSGYPILRSYNLGLNVSF